MIVNQFQEKLDTLIMYNSNKHCQFMILIMQSSLLKHWYLWWVQSNYEFKNIPQWSKFVPGKNGLLLEFTQYCHHIFHDRLTGLTNSVITRQKVQDNNNRSWPIIFSNDMKINEFIFWTHKSITFIWSSSLILKHFKLGIPIILKRGEYSLIGTNVNQTTIEK